MKKISAILALSISVFVAMPAWADAEKDELRAEIEGLKARLSALETKLTEQTQPMTAGGHSWHETAPVITLPSALSGVAISGYVDATYDYNFNSPDTRTNVGRVFDRHSNSFNLNAAEVDLQKPVSADSRVGFRTDLFFGNDAEVIGSTGLGLTTDEFDLEQAYVEILVPTSNAIPGLNDIDLKAGKFVTLLGAEVIESKDNWNASRGLLFGFAIPFTHTGALATYTFNNGWDIAGGVVNGWDVVDDTNNDKTAIAHFGFNNIALGGDSSLTVSLNGVTGAEAAGDDHSKRTVGDIVAIYKTPWKPLTLMYNFDYGQEENLLVDPRSSLSTLVDSATWFGHAGYARIDLNDQWSISGRGEYFNDDNGVRVVSGTPATYWELTGTLEYRPWKNLITRLEVRYDDSDRNVYNEDTLPRTALTDSQTTIMGEAIFVF